MKELKATLTIEPSNEPLMDRVPTRDEFGKPLSDLMVLLPGLRDKSKFLITNTINEINTVLGEFSGTVVFAELNIRRNMLWVSVRPVRGIRATIASEIRAKVPEAKLVSHL